MSHGPATGARSRDRCTVIDESGIYFKDYLWQRETALHGPYQEDEWHCDCIRQECERRERPEIFLDAENNILAQIRKTAEL